jgi:hypothetical protein
VCDDVEMLDDLPSPRWPLHPMPYRFERLDTYIRRLAERYGTQITTFCRCGLGREVGSLDAFAADPPRWALERLSAGTGLPLWQLRNMTTRRSMIRIALALRKLAREHPELVQKWFL